MTSLQMARGMTARTLLTRALTYLLLALGGVASFVPFFWMATSAFKLPQQITTFPPVWIPSPPTMANMHKIWGELDFARNFANSVFVSVTPTALVLLTSAFVGYVLAKFAFRGRELLFIGILATMMVPYPVTLIPRYQMMSWFEWIDSFWALIIPHGFSSFGIFLVRQFMHSVPDELIDAGRIDGASEMRILFQLVIPISIPVLSALAIFHFMWNWDAFLWPFLVMNSQRKFPLTVALAGQFESHFTTDYAGVMAGATISVIPVLIVYLLLQRQFVAGVALTGMKG